MKEKRKILFFCMIIVANGAFAQFGPKADSLPYIKSGSVWPTRGHRLNAYQFYSPCELLCHATWLFLQKRITFRGINRLPLKFRVWARFNIVIGWKENPMPAFYHPVKFKGNRIVPNAKADYSFRKFTFCLSYAGYLLAVALVRVF